MTEDEKREFEKTLYDIGTQIQELGKDLTNSEYKYTENHISQVVNNLQICVRNLEDQIKILSEFKT